MTSHPRRRAAVLLEVLLALALFIATALTLTGVVGTTLRAMQSSRDDIRAANIARSAMALLEAGVYTPEALSGPAPAELLGGEEESLTTSNAADAWTLEIETERTSFSGLTLVSVTAIRDADETPGPKFCQYVRLGSASDTETGIGDIDDIAQPARFNGSGPDRFGASGFGPSNEDADQ